MKYYLKSHSILAEKIFVVFYMVVLLLLTSFFIIISIMNLSWIGFSFSIVYFFVLIYSVYSVISIFRNTIDYKVIFFDSYFHIKSKKYDFIIEYNQIKNMSLKRNYSFMSPRYWLYLEIECGLLAPVYVNFSHVQANKLRDITDENFIKHYDKILNWNRIVERRNKNNLL